MFRPLITQRKKGGLFDHPTLSFYHKQYSPVNHDLFLKITFSLLHYLGAFREHFDPVFLYNIPS